MLQCWISLQYIVSSGSVTGCVISKRTGDNHQDALSTNSTNSVCMEKRLKLYRQPFSVQLNDWIKKETIGTNVGKI